MFDYDTVEELDSMDDVLIDDDRCPLCGSKSISPLGILSSLYWWRCRQCGYDFPTAEALSERYDITIFD